MRKLGQDVQVYYDVGRASLAGSNLYSASPPAHPAYGYVYPPMANSSQSSRFRQACEIHCWRSKPDLTFGTPLCYGCLLILADCIRHSSE